MDNKNKVIGTILIVLLILLITTTLISFNSGHNKNVNGLNDYESIQELKSSITFDLDIPTFIYKEKNIKISSVLGQMIEISNEKFKLKASIWVDNNADPLGIYDVCEDDNKYNVKDSDITYFRIRKSKDNTIINWVKNGTSYGLVEYKDMSLKDILDILNLKEDNLIKITDNNNIENKENTKEYTEYLEKENVKFTFYNMTNIEKMEVPNEAIYYSINKEIILLVVYNNPDKYLNNLKSDDEYKLYNGVYFIYSNSNKDDNLVKLLDNISTIK